MSIFRIFCIKVFFFTRHGEHGASVSDKVSYIFVHELVVDPNRGAATGEMQ